MSLRMQLHRGCPVRRP